MAAVALAGLCLGLALRLDAGDLHPLAQNGFVFTTGGEPCAIHAVDMPALLGMPALEQEKALDRASLLGFNAVSFECPLYGPGGLYLATRSKPDPAFCQALAQSLSRLRVRLLYPMPVLWTASAAASLEQALGLEPGAFFTDKRCLQWQAYQLKGLADVRDAEGRRLAGFEDLGAWLLYKGPVPGPEQAFASWAEAQCQSLQGLKMPQLAGAWLLPGTATAGSDAFFNWLARTSSMGSLGFLAAQDPAAEAEAFYAQAAEQAWRKLDIPLLACMDGVVQEKGNLPSLAGSVLPLPEPGEGEDLPLWDDKGPRSRFELHPVAMAFAQVEARMDSPGKAVLSLRVNRPASLRLAWDRQMPMRHHLVSLDPGLVHEADLSGVKKGQRILVEARAESERFGRAVLRPTWVEVQEALPYKDKLEPEPKHASAKPKRLPSPLPTATPTTAIPVSIKSIIDVFTNPK